jgi:hypothetical protein
MLLILLLIIHVSSQLTALQNTVVGDCWAQRQDGSHHAQQQQQQQHDGQQPPAHHQHAV